MARQKCCVITCKNSRMKNVHKGTSFFGFPKCPEKHKKWLEAIGSQRMRCKDNQTNSTKLYLCDKHFEINSFKETGPIEVLIDGKLVQLPRKRKILKNETVPILFEDTISSCTGTSGNGVILNDDYATYMNDDYEYEYSFDDFVNDLEDPEQMQDFPSTWRFLKLDAGVLFLYIKEVYASHSVLVRKDMSLEFRVSGKVRLMPQFNVLLSFVDMITVCQIFQTVNLCEGPGYDMSCPDILIEPFRTKSSTRCEHCRKQRKLLKDKTARKEARQAASKLKAQNIIRSLRSDLRKMRRSKNKQQTNFYT